MEEEPRKSGKVLWWALAVVSCLGAVIVLVMATVIEDGHLRARFDSIMFAATFLLTLVLLGVAIYHLIRTLGRGDDQ